MENRRTLRGVISALVNPMEEDGRIDVGNLERQIEFISQAEVAGLFLNGTTGEGPYLSETEKQLVIQKAKEISNGSQFFCLACLSPSTQQVIEEIDRVGKYEPDYVVATLPYYFSVSQDEIVDHFERIADRSDFPVIAYVIPQCTSNTPTLDTIVRISRIPNIVGLKDSSGEFSRFNEAMRMGKADGFAWINGDDSLAGASLTAGAAALVSGMSNVHPRIFTELVNASTEQDGVRVAEIQEVIDTLRRIIPLCGGRTVSAIKAALTSLGRSKRWVKPPVSSPTESQVQDVASVLRKIGIA